MLGTLYLVATPIGNLQDMSFRAVDTLHSVDLIAAEDTRHTRKLLNHFQISTRLISNHEHNEKERADELAERLLAGESIAVVSDAGTPGICDPAFRIVGRAVEIGAQVISIPGPVAFVNAVVASGISTDSMFFGGFLPAKKGERRKRLEEVKDIPATLVFYETPHRIARSLADCAEILGDRKAAIARELTKLHEEIVRGSLSHLATMFAKERVKGEIVIVVDRLAAVQKVFGEPSAKQLSKSVKEHQKTGVDPKTALKKAAKEFGVSKSRAYKILLDEK